MIYISDFSISACFSSLRSPNCWSNNSEKQQLDSEFWSDEQAVQLTVEGEAGLRGLKSWRSLVWSGSRGLSSEPEPEPESRLELETEPESRLEPEPELKPELEPELELEPGV